MTETALLVIFGLAILYSSVGHGGASGYLAVMAILGMTPDIMRPTALILNLFVSAIAFMSFKRKGHFNSVLFLPFIMASVPAAFLGGMLTIDPHLYRIILGILLLFAVFRLSMRRNVIRRDPVRFRIWLALILGLLIGFVSGLIGIGGGIILSPLILLLGWSEIKGTAAISAAFIFVNSASGLTGQAMSGLRVSPDIFLMAGAGLMGGLIGSYFGSSRASNLVLRYTLSAVLVLASLKLVLL